MKTFIVYYPVNMKTNKDCLPNTAMYGPVRKIEEESLQKALHNALFNEDDQFSRRMCSGDIIQEYDKYFMLCKDGQLTEVPISYVEYIDWEYVKQQQNLLK